MLALCFVLLCVLVADATHAHAHMKRALQPICDVSKRATCNQAGECVRSPAGTAHCVCDTHYAGRNCQFQSAKRRLEHSGEHRRHHSTDQSSSDKSESESGSSSSSSSTHLPPQFESESSHWSIKTHYTRDEKSDDDDDSSRSSDKKSKSNSSFYRTAKSGSSSQHEDHSESAPSGENSGSEKSDHRSEESNGSDQSDHHTEEHSGSAEENSGSDSGSGSDSSSEPRSRRHNHDSDLSGKAEWTRRHRGDDDDDDQGRWRRNPSNQKRGAHGSASTLALSVAVPLFAALQHALF